MEPVAIVRSPDGSLRSAADDQLTADPTHPDYRAFIRRHVRELLHQLQKDIYDAERFMNDWQDEPATVPIPLDDLRQIASAWRAAGFEAAG